MRIRTGVRKYNKGKKARGLLTSLCQAPELSCYTSHLLLQMGVLPPCACPSCVMELHQYIAGSLCLQGRLARPTLGLSNVGISNNYAGLKRKHLSISGHFDQVRGTGKLGCLHNLILANLAILGARDSDKKGYLIFHKVVKVCLRFITRRRLYLVHHARFGQNNRIIGKENIDVISLLLSHFCKLECSGNTCRVFETTGQNK